VIGRIDQICFLVDDIDASIEGYSQLFGATRWRGYRYGPDTVPQLVYRGEPGRFSFWIALSDCDPQIELIQSLEGPSVYTEWIEARGLGFHHIGTFTRDMAADTAALQAMGLAVSQWGRGYGLDGDGGFTYLDSLQALGVVVELIEIPARRRTPDREWVVSRKGPPAR
jgi:catechol 2,3-dioxygenase-like lactoylglutathione lyase family enzyme